LIAYIKGEITFKKPTFIHIETGGIGYHVNISLNTFALLENKDRLKLYTHLQVKEDSHTLYGFVEKSERDIFRMLISVSGIGTNTARIILSSMSAQDVKNCIVNEDVARFSSVKGIGPKTAQRVILDLKDKILKTTDSFESSLINKEGASIRQEAISALNALGFQKSAILKKIDLVLSKNPQINQVEELLKLVLKQLS